MESDVPQNERKLLQIMVWGSTIAVAGSMALMFGFDNRDGQFRYELSISSVIAFVISLFVMLMFWKRVFKLWYDPKRTWRFIIVCSILSIVGFIGLVFLPQFRPAGAKPSDLLQGMIFGFAAVGFVFYLAHKTMQLLEKADNEANAASREKDV